MKDTELTEFYLRSQTGFHFSSPPMIMMPIYCEPKESWAKKRYNDLRWKVCQRVAVWRGILATLIAIVVFTIINTGLFFLCLLGDPQIILLGVAFLDFQLLRLIFLVVPDFYDGNNVTLERRNRELTYEY